jgi:hypothetical protein
MTLDPDSDLRFERARQMTPAEKFEEICRLTDIDRQHIMDDLRTKHPHTSELELKCMFAYEWLGEELARKFWPFYLKGIEEGRVPMP